MSVASSYVVAVLVGGLLTLTLPASPASAALPAQEPDNTGMVNGKVRSIVQAGGRIWVGGAFTQMLDANGNAVRAVNNLAAFNASTGAPDLAVSIPSVTRTTGTIVYDMSVGPDGKVYMAGAFDKVNGQTRKNVAAFDPNTGALTSFSATPANATAVLATGDAVYVGTSKLLKYTLSGAAAPGYGPPEVDIDPAIRGHEIPAQFRDIVIVGSTLVAACQCDSLNDGSGFVGVKSLVKIDAGSGTLVNWDPAGLDAQSASFGISAFVRDFPSASDRTVYLASGGSDFTAAYDYESGNQRWKTDTSGSSQVVAWHQNTLIVGGHFQWVPKSNNQQCNDNANPNTQCWHAPRLVAMDPSDGDVILEGGSPWNPGICCKYNGVWAMLVDQDGGKLHVGGEFTKAGGTWSGAGTSWNLNASQNQDYYARFFAPATGSQTLTVSRSGAGGGSVTSSPAGINCGTTCSASYAINAMVTLTATPAAGSTFAGWGGDCTGTASTCTVSMSSSRTVVATFVPVNHTLTVTKGGAGVGTVASSPAGISCSNACPSQTASFPEGTVVTLSATASGSNVFTGWSGAGCSGTGPCQVTMSAAASVQASFEPPRTLGVTKSGAGSGTVTSSPGPIDCGTTCSGTFAQGSTVTLTATAAADSVFTGWSGDCGGTATTCSVTMDVRRDANANFELRTHLLTVVTAGQGTGSVTADTGSIDCPDVDCDDTYTQPTVVTLTATPDAGSTFAGFSGGGCSGSGDTCQVTMSQARTVTATFAVPNELIVVVDGPGAVTSEPAGIDCPANACTASFPSDSVVTLTADPDPDRQFTGWSGAGCSGTALTCQVTMDQAKTVTATFTDINHLLTVVTAGQGTGSVTADTGSIDCPDVDCDDTYTQPTVVTLTATPDAGSTFAGFSGGGCSGSGDTCQVTMSQARTVTATFAVPNELIVVVDGPGAVTSEPAGIDCPANACTASFPSDSVVTLTADPDPDRQFTGWSGAGCSGTALTCQVTMDQAQTVTATFTDINHLLTVVTAGQGTGSVTADTGSIDCPDVDCDDTYTQPTVVTLTATPDAGSTFAGFSGGGCSGSGDTCQVTMSQARTVTATFAVPSACGRIVFSSNRSGNPDVWVMGADGTNETNLTNRSGSDTEPAWSPDCSKIAFSSTRSGNVDIYVMNADGTGTQRLTTHASADTEPTWSPDGSAIAFVSARTGNAEIFTMSTDGTNQLNRSNNTATDTSPDWSPDGTKIAFDSTRGGGLNVWTMTSTGGSPTRITTGLGRAQAPAWSPSGAVIALVSDSSGRDQIWTVAANGSGPSRLTNDVGVHSHPSWSPDGSKLAYANTVAGGKNQIWVVNQDGSGAVNTSTSTKLDTLPGWAA